MAHNLTMTQAHKYLDSLLIFGIKLGLENMNALLELLGHPEKELKFIHLAGTNGKGSTGAILATALKGGGYKTGFYSSPFLKDFCERWRIDGLPAEEELFCNALNEIISLEDELVKITGVRPTYFEVLTAVAVLIFKAQKCDFVVWETGMGGRLDATNAVTPIITAITNVSADHQQFLGENISDIAREKAGIIKKDIPLIGGDFEPEIEKIIIETANAVQAPAKMKNRDWHIKSRSDSDCQRILPGSQVVINTQKESFSATTAMAGFHQADNLALAAMCLKQMADDKYINNLETVLSGTQSAFWPGRLHQLPNGMLCDGAHNPAGIESLVKTLQSAHPSKKWHITIGMLADKDWRANLRLLFPIIDSINFVPVANPRTLKPSEAVEFMRENNINAMDYDNLPEALSASENLENRLCLGSLYLIGELLTLTFKDDILPLDDIS